MGICSGIVFCLHNNAEPVNCGVSDKTDNKVIFIKVFILFTCLGALLFPAHAHRQNESYVYLNVTDATLSGRIEITLGDLGQLLPLDTNEDGVVSEDEFNGQKKDIYAFFQPRLAFSFEQQKYPIAISGHEFLTVGFGTFAAIKFSITVTSKLPDALTVEYKSYFENLRPGHRVLLLLESNTKTGLSGNESSHSLVFSKGADTQNLSLIGAPWYEVFAIFVKHGVLHILIGYDHEAFLLALLLSSVLLVRNGKFVSVPRFRDALIKVLKIATLFTIAHSVTLSLAAMGWIKFPERIIESLIAFSIIVVAFNNLFAFKERWVWIAVFSLGLVHGLGFANVLAPLGVASASIVTSLLAFNVGVEVGQAVIILVCFPILYYLRNTAIYVPLILRGGSIGLLLIALLWFFERAFQFNLPIVPMVKSLVS